LLVHTKQNLLTKDECYAYLFLAYISGVLVEKDSAFFYYDKLIQKATDIKDDKFLLICKINKSDYLFNEYDFDGALRLYNDCLTLAKNSNNTAAYNYIFFKKGSINFELENYKEALGIFKKSIQYKEFDKATLMKIKINLAKTYLKLKESDSALVYIKKGVQESREYNLKEFEVAFLIQQALLYIDNNDLSGAEKTFNEALILAQKYEDPTLLMTVQLNIAKLYTLQKKYKESLKLLIAMNEIDQKKPIAAEYLSEIYYLLAENYKSMQQFSLSNEYYQKFIEKSKKLGQKKIEAIDYLHKMDVSNIDSQRVEQERQKWWLVIVIGLLIVLIGLFIYRKSIIEKANQNKFDELLKKINQYEDQSAEIQGNEKLTLASNHFNEQPMIVLEDKKQSNNEDGIISNAVDLTADTLENFEEEELNEDFEEFENQFEEEETNAEDLIANNAFIIKDEKINEILEKLVKLEEKKYFLKQECTLHSVAKRLRTNTAYLSKIINNELGKSFSTYINELRINYIIIELKNNAKLRSYSVSAIAEEIGYKRPEAFTKYFKDATGISPTIYIKKINKLKEI
jgi:YesN/AraC family two-component response regulator